MSDRTNHSEEPACLYRIYTANKDRAPQLFWGTEDQAIAHINRLHDATGLQHAARAIGKEE